MTKERTAFISVANHAKTEATVAFARELQKLGFRIISSGGTATYLRDQGVEDVRDLAELIGGGAILGHKVVTLDRKFSAALLADPKLPEEMIELDNLGMPMIDLLYCVFYPMSETIKKPGATVESVIKDTDIGGPTMVRAAAKGGRIVICDQTDLQWVIDKLKDLNDLDIDDRQKLRAKAEYLVGQYCLQAADFHSAGLYLGLTGRHERRLAYAENKCQNPADLFSDGSDDPLALHRFDVKTGDPSYTAKADHNGILEIICTLAEAFRQSKGKVPYIAIAGKHGNPCGAAIDWVDPGIALLKALCGDKVAVMGGEVITNFPITGELGNLLYNVPPNMNIGRPKWGLDLVVAPSFEPEAVEYLNKYEKRRLLANPALSEPFLPKTEWMYKPVRGGFLRQRAYPFTLSPNGVKEWVNEPLSAADFDTLLVAWAVCWKASSNTVALAKDNMLIGLGCGQQDRIACVRLCLSRANRAGHDPKGAVFTSDAFFPFANSEANDAVHDLRLEILSRLKDCDRDSISKEALLSRLGKIALMVEAIDNREGTELLIDAGCKGGLVTADGKELPNVQELFKKSGLSVAFVAAEFRGFSKH